MIPMRRPSVAKRTKVNRAGVREEKRKPVLPGIWIYVGTFVAVDSFANDPPQTNGWSPPYENGWIYSSDPDHDYPAFRHAIDGRTEWKGILDGSASTNIQFTTLPFNWRPDFTTPVTINTVGTPGIAVLTMFATGEVTCEPI